MRGKFYVMTAAVMAATMLTAGVAMAADSQGTTVTIETRASTLTVGPDETFDITVPSVIPIVFNEDGTNTYPTNFTITNNHENGGVYLKKVDMTQAAGSDWSLLDAAANTKTLGHDTKKIQFYMGKADDLKLVAGGDSTGTTTGAVEFDEGYIDLAAAGDGVTDNSMTMSFNVNRAIFTQAESASTAFDMNMQFAFK